MSKHDEKFIRPWAVAVFSTLVTYIAILSLTWFTGLWVVVAAMATGWLSDKLYVDHLVREGLVK